MGFLNNSIVTVDAILTRKGRELLAKNDGSFRITQFALADDEIDYTMYNPDHPEGSTSTYVKYTGEAILTSYEKSGAIGDVVTYSAEFQVTGAVTRGTYS